MTQKVLRVGSSAAVTIPKKSLKELGLKVGDSVIVDVDSSKRTVTISSQKKKDSEQEKVARLTLQFIKRYRRDLEALSNR